MYRAPLPSGKKIPIFPERRGDLYTGLRPAARSEDSWDKKIRSTHLFHYTNHIKQNLIFRWGVGKHALQTSKGSMVFTKVTKFQKIHYVKMKNLSRDNLVTHNSSQIPLVLDRTGIYKCW